MATHSLLDHLRTTLLPQGAADLTDAELLDRYVARHDEAAFKALLLRHGPMVWGVCRRALQSPHDAEDAFQATFLVLARKAASVQPRERVGNWLYGVAYHAALKARAMAARRRAKEREAAARGRTAEPAEDTGWELAGLLDRELQRLPSIYRTPVVVCDLQGKTRTEAARQLGWPEGTVAGRLARARALLARRLSRYGLALAGAVLAEGAASASLPASLVASTVKAAGQGGVIPARVVALVEGALRAMSLNKVLQMTAALLVVVAVVTAGWYGYTAASATPPPGKRVAEARQKGPAEAKSDLDRMQGIWRVVSSQVGDERATDEEVKRRKVTVKGNVLSYDYGNEQKKKQEGTVRLDPKAKHLDWTWTSPASGTTMLALYELKGDDLKIGFGNDGQVRPQRWSIGKDDVVWLLVLKREEPRNQGRSFAPAGNARVETPVQKEWKRLIGTWTPVALEQEGKKASGEEFKRLEFAKDVLSIQQGKCQVRSNGGKPLEAALKIDPTAKPKRMERTSKLGTGEVLVSHSLYEVTGDTLKICTNFENDRVPPKGFTSKGSFVLVYRRAKQ
jgi:RNA polymerase sigma factor (sigma-70 family)